MAVLFSRKFKIPKERLNELGVFDVLLDEDSPFFINIKKLQNCTIPEFKDSYEHVNTRFREIGLLLSKSTPGSKLYTAAYKRFNFPEVNGINLGFASGKHGAGFGEQLRKQIINDAFEIIQNGCNEPEIFHLVSLFEENVGPDRLSDMIARIIYSDIVQYSKRIYRELGITSETYPRLKFKDGLLINPYKRYYLLLLPKCILHELPIARCWDDIDRVCAENDAIRAEINEMISKEWSKMSAFTRKRYLRENVFKNPEKAMRIITAYKKYDSEEYNIFSNPEYITEYLKGSYKWPQSKSSSSYEAAMEITEHFKKWVEFHRGASVINGVSAKPSEKLIQIMIHGVAQMFCEKFNWDFSPETDSGRGPVDFKVSRGIDKTVIEVKLSSNQGCVHGLAVQIEEYAKAEGTTNKIYLLVDLGKHQEMLTRVKKKHKEMIDSGLKPATLVIIDAVPKASASKY